MRGQYDFAKSVKNPYRAKAKKRLTIRLDEDTIQYFKALAQQNGIPYQNLINLYLRECAESNKALKMTWNARPRTATRRLSTPPKHTPKNLSHVGGVLVLARKNVDDDAIAVLKVVLGDQPVAGDDLDDACRHLRSVSAKNPTSDRPRKFVASQLGRPGLAISQIGRAQVVQFGSGNDECWRWSPRIEFPLQHQRT